MEEIWKDVVGFEGQYQVSTYGRIKSIDRFRISKGRDKPAKLKEKLLKLPINRKGYLKASLCKNGKMHHFIAHRIVATAFIENPLNKPQINHIDGNKQNNHVSNLEWCTSSENNKHAQRTGLCVSQKGSNNNGAILTEEIVFKIKIDRKNGIFMKDLAKKYGVSFSTIEKISSNRMWKHVTTD